MDGRASAVLDGPETIFVVVNKIDSVSNIDLVGSLCESIHRAAGQKIAGIVQASATLSNGIQSLIGQLETHLNSLCPERGSAVPFTAEQMRWLRIAGGSGSR